MANIALCWHWRMWRLVRSTRRRAWGKVLHLCCRSANRNLPRRFCLCTCSCEAWSWSTKARKMKPGGARSWIRNTGALGIDGFVIPRLVAVALIAVLDAVVKMQIRGRAQAFVIKTRQAEAFL